MTRHPAGLSRTVPKGTAGPSALVAIGHRLETRMIALAVLLALALSILSPDFLTRVNVITIIDQSVVIGTVAVGMTAVILTGGIDLSVGAVAGFTGILLALALQHVGLPLALVVTVLTGAGIGLVSGLLINLGGLAPYLVTLGVMAIGRSLAGILSGQMAISGLPDTLQDLVQARLVGVPANVLFLAALYIAAWAFLTYAKGGRTLYALGSNKGAARAAGLRTGLYAVFPYVLSGGLAALAGIFTAGRLLAADPGMGSGLELDAIAAVVIGGTSLWGGRGSIVGTLVGVLLVVMLRNGLALAGFSSLWQGTAVGFIVIAAPLAERVAAAWRNRR